MSYSLPVTGSGSNKAVTAEDHEDSINAAISDALAAGGVIHLVNIAGTADAVTADVPADFADVALNLGRVLQLRWPTTNTAADPTVTFGGVAYTVKRQGGGALVAGDLNGGSRYFAHIASTSPAVIRIMQPLNAAELNG